MAALLFFVVRAKRSYGTITYNCPTAEWALKKLRDFQAAGYQSISVMAPDGAALDEAELISIVEGAASTPRSATTRS